jgi:hypothetical protein
VEDLAVTAARIAGEIVRTLQPRTVLDACGSNVLLEQLRNCGMQALSPDLLQNRATPHCDLIVCLGEFGSVQADAIEHILFAADTILFSPVETDRTSLLAWIERFSDNGFAPDPSYDAGAIASRAMLLRRAQAWPREALRLFVDSLSWRELASELANERRLTQTLREIQARLSTEAQDIREQVHRMQGSVDEGRLRAIEATLRRDFDARLDELKTHAQDDSDLRAHLARLDRRVIELNRGIQAMSGRIEGILASRTWRMLTTLGGVVLRLTGRKG